MLLERLTKEDFVGINEGRSFASKCLVEEERLGKNKKECNNDEQQQAGESEVF